MHVPAFQKLNTKQSRGRVKRRAVGQDDFLRAVTTAIARLNERGDVCTRAAIIQEICAVIPIRSGTVSCLLSKMSGDEKERTGLTRHLVTVTKPRMGVLRGPRL